MAPLFAPANQLDQRSADAEAKRQHGAWFWAVKDLKCLFGVEFGQRLFFALQDASRVAHDICAYVRSSSLGARVGHVVGMGSEEQVGRVNAGRIVATVTHKKAWQFSVCQQPSYAMGTHNPAAEISTKVNDSISRPLGCARPKPTGIWTETIHLGPKTLFEGCLGWHVGVDYLTGGAYVGS